MPSGRQFAIPNFETRTPALPFASMNLRFNPFGELPLEQRALAALPRCDWEPLIPSLQQSRRAIQFMGPCGSGKSTHLHLVSATDSRFRYMYLPRWKSTPVASARQLMVDEAQRLSRRQRQQLFRYANQIVLGTHRDLNRSLRRAGFRVTTIRLDRAPTPVTLATMLNRKIEWARRAPGDVPSISTNQAETFLKRFGNNLRDLHAWLYEEFQQSAAVQDRTSPGYPLS